MSDVYVGSARIDERGEARGGKSGDQTGKEVSIQKWYRHSKGWRVLRAVEPSKRKLIADAMRAACDNPMIGYDQNQRNTLYTAASAVGFDLSRVATACETDCSALARVCAAYAGIKCESFNTATQANVLIATGEFVELIGAKYTDKPDYLREGDILVTKTQGHTVVVLNDGKLASDDTVDNTPIGHVLGERTLKYIPEQTHMHGEDVRELQTLLQNLGYFDGTPLGNYKTITQRAVKAFQAASGLEADGIYGPKTHAALMLAVATAATDADIVTVITDNAVLYSGIGAQLEVAVTVPKDTVMSLRDPQYIPVVFNGVDYWIDANDVSLG